MEGSLIGRVVDCNGIRCIILGLGYIIDDISTYGHTQCLAIDSLLLAKCKTPTNPTPVGKLFYKNINDVTFEG